MNDLIQENGSYIVMAILLAWILWRRVLAPKLSGVKTIAATDYMKMRDGSHTLVDVRQPEEWSAGHAKSALHIPLSEVATRMDEIPKDKPVVVICASGNRSAMAATKLAKSGFEDVYNFAGGMGSWRSAGLPVKSRS